MVWCSATQAGAYGDICNASGGLANQGTWGNYWSSTQYSAASPYNLNFNSSGNVNPQNNNDSNGKAAGRTVRCIELVWFFVSILKN